MKTRREAKDRRRQPHAQWGVLFGGFFVFMVVAGLFTRPGRKIARALRFGVVKLLDTPPPPARKQAGATESTRWAPLAEADRESARLAFSGGPVLRTTSVQADSLLRQFRGEEDPALLEILARRIEELASNLGERERGRVLEMLEDLRFVKLDESVRKLADSGEIEAAANLLDRYTESSLSDGWKASLKDLRNYVSSKASAALPGLRHEIR